MSDKTIRTPLPKRLRIMAGMLAMGERISFGSDSALMEDAAAEIERLEKELETTEDALMAESDNNAVLAND